MSSSEFQPRTSLKPANGRPSPTPFAQSNNSKTLTLSKVATRSAQNQRSRKSKLDPAERGRLIMYRHVSNLNKISRVLSYATTIASTAGGVIALSAYASFQAQSFPAADWANISNEFDVYRVRQMRVHLFPATTNSTATTGPYQSCIALSRWWGTVPTSWTGMASDPGFVAFSTLEEAEMENNWLSFPDAQQWVPVASTIPTGDSFGIALITPTGAAATAVSSVIFTALVQWTVEFQGTS
jgi:hypothetical protein